MVKIIQFNDAKAIWNNESIIVPDMICRITKNVDVLPESILLVFNCNENDLGNVSSNREMLREKVQEYYVPDF